VAAQAAEGGEKGQEGIVVLHGGVEAEDLIQLRYSWGKIYLAGWHSHLIDKNKQNVWFHAHFLICSLFFVRA
jgi:hypothetical protein